MRIRAEEQAQIALAEARRQADDEQRRLEEARKRLDAVRLQRGALLRRAIDVGDLVNSEAAESKARDAIEAQAERLRLAESAAVSALQGLRMRSTERETLERLRQRRMAEHAAAEMAVEQKILDEISVRRWRDDGRY